MYMYIYIHTHTHAHTHTHTHTHTQLAACTTPPDGSPKICADNHPAVSRVGGPGGTLLYMTNPDFFPRMNTLLQETPLETMKAIMSWQVMRAQ